jgi:LysR family cys regulon transcriptional activator
MGADLIAAMAYDPLTSHDLLARNLSHLIPSSRIKIAYLNYKGTSKN